MLASKRLFSGARMKITLVIAGFALASLIGCSQQQTTTNKPQEPPKPPEKWQGVHLDSRSGLI